MSPWPPSSPTTASAISRQDLAAEGTNFNAVVDDVRREMTERYLRDTDMTRTHLARQLGYAEQSVLSRACQRWFGATPAALREKWRRAQLPPAFPVLK
nr:helix-turn-helix domain-containing protein [Mycobacterium shottsii]